MSQDRQNLDALLKQARWAEPSGESTRRLEEFWKNQWNSRPMRANWLLPMAAAAAILVGLGSVIVLVLLPPRTPPVALGPVHIRPVPKVTPKPVMMESRPPTMRELMFLRAMGASPTTRPAPIQEPPQDARSLAEAARQEEEPRRQREALAELLRCDDAAAVSLYLQFVVDPMSRDVALEALADVKEPPVQAFIDDLGNSRVAIRFAAARVLGRIDGPVTTEQLVWLIQRNKQRREALAALLYSGGPDAAAFLDDARRRPSLAGTLRAVEMQMQTVQ
jgi:hypothetical protein